MSRSPVGPMAKAASRSSGALEPWWCDPEIQGHGAPCRAVSIRSASLSSGHTSATPAACFDRWLGSGGGSTARVHGHGGEGEGGPAHRDDGHRVILRDPTDEGGMMATPRMDPQHRVREGLDAPPTDSAPRRGPRWQRSLERVLAASPSARSSLLLHHPMERIWGAMRTYLAKPRWRRWPGGCIRCRPSLGSGVRSGGCGVPCRSGRPGCPRDARRAYGRWLRTM